MTQAVNTCLCFYYILTMNNPIFRIPLEIFITLCLVLHFVDIPKQEVILSETKSIDSFCDREKDNVEFMSLKIKYNLSDALYDAYYYVYCQKEVVQQKRLTQDDYVMEYACYVLIYMLILCLICTVIPWKNNMIFILPITDLLLFCICKPFKMYKAHRQYKKNLNKTTFDSISSTVKDISKFLKD